MKRLFSCIAILWFASCAVAFAQTPQEQQDLYLDAMRSISEGRQADATEALDRIISREPQHAGAWLDLAIIHCRLGHAAQAEQLFKTIETRFSPPPGILEVIAAYRAKGCDSWQRKSKWSVNLARGADSNVNQGASSPTFSIGSGSSQVDLQIAPEFLPLDDPYTLLSGTYMGDVTANGVEGFAQFRARRNDSLSRYNTASLVVGLEKPWRLGAWTVRGTGNVGLLTLGDRLYQKQEQLQARITPPPFLPDAWDFSVLTGLTHVNYETLANFNGNTTELTALLGYRTDRSQLQATAGYLFDRGSSERLGGNRTGWHLGLQSHTRISDSLMVEAGWTNQHWKGDSVYSPGLIDKIRRQDMQLFRAAVVLPLKNNHSIQLEWRHIKNDENISLFQYNSRLLQITWQWQNF